MIPNDSAEEKFRRALEGGMDKYVKQQARNTIALNAERDVACAGYARIPGPNACDFCVTMGAASDFYHSEKTAGGGAKHGTAEDHYHPYCNCQVCVIFKKNDKLLARDPGTGEAVPYNGAEMVQRYQDIGAPTFAKNRAREAEARRAARRRIANDDLVLKSKADPALDYFGSAEKSHPEDLRHIKEDLAKSGVSVNVRDRAHEAMGYGPSSVPGEPGSMTVTEGMSYSAWKHEYVHFQMDRELGYPTRMAYYEDLRLYARMEEVAYNAELALAEENGYNELAETIKIIRNNAVSEILRGELF